MHLLTHKIKYCLYSFLLTFNAKRCFFLENSHLTYIMLHVYVMQVQGPICLFIIISSQKFNYSYSIPELFMSQCIIDLLLLNNFVQNKIHVSNFLYWLISNSLRYWWPFCTYKQTIHHSCAIILYYVHVRDDNIPHFFQVKGKKIWRHK